MNETSTHTPRPFLLLVGTTVLAGLVLFLVSWSSWPPQWSYQLALVVVAAAVSETFVFTLPGFTISLAYPLAMSAIILGGPAAAGVVAAVSSGVIPDLRARRPASIIMFNLSQQVLLACLGGWIYVLLGGPVLQQAGVVRSLVASDFPSAFYGMAGAATIVPIVNLALVSLGVSLYSGQRFRALFLSAAGIFIPTQVALALVGFLMAQVLAVNVLALPLFVFPLIVARQLYQRYAAMRAAYADTVRSLVGALEAKDPYTRGHSERVALYAVALGESLGLDEQARERLEYAALLHDLGKLSVPGGVLTKPGPLTPEEMQDMRAHPTRGAEMIRRIPPLKDLAEHVGNHHEWYAGGGYPTGVDSEDIPPLAMILSVADCYDAMTTTRAYRPALSHDEAVAELVRGAGTQFDPETVRVFIESRIGRAITPTCDEPIAGITSPAAQGS